MSAILSYVKWRYPGTVATDIANAALLEHWTRSSSVAMIFFTRATSRPDQRCPIGTFPDIRGREDVPVISSGGGIAVLLYGIFRGEGRSEDKERRKTDFVVNRSNHRNDLIGPI